MSVGGRIIARTSIARDVHAAVRGKLVNFGLAVARIVVIEDQTLLREGMIAMLETVPDMKVIGSAANAADGLRLCGEQRPDVVLLDLGLPDLPGMDVLRRIKADYPDLRVIVVTVHDEEGYVTEALRAGADGYLLKTISQRELAEAVLSVLRGEPALHPAVAKKVLRGFVAISRGERLAGELSGREREVVRLLAEGMSNRQIADALKIGVETVKTHVSSIIEKLGATDRTHAVVLALRRGLVQ